MQKKSIFHDKKFEHIGMYVLHLYGPRYEPVVDFCDHGNETWGSRRSWTFIKRLSYCHILKTTGHTVGKYTQPFPDNSAK
jgi:hypothetical protein